MKPIFPNEYISTGKVIKTHGTAGAILVSVEAAGNPFRKRNLRFLFFDIDGSFVPFRIESYQPGPGERIIVSLEWIDTPEKASCFTGKQYYVHRSFIPKERATGLQGLEPGKFKVIDKNAGYLGIASGIEGSSANPLLVVENDGAVLYIPVNGNFITGISDVALEILVDAPADLLDLNV